MDGITLRAGKYEATFRPDAAMLCTSLQYDGDEYVAWPRTLDEFRAGRATAIPLVHPWANRLAGDTYRAAGEDVSLAGLTLPHDSNGLPMHGNLLGVEFEVELAEDTRVVATLDYGACPEKLRAFPFPHRLTVDARLHPKRGLNIVTRVEPTTEQPVPISFGWHPFLQLPNAPRSEWELRWPACQHVEVDERVVPTGIHTARPAERAPIAQRTLLFSPTYPYAQLFVPPDKEIVAIEPMTAEIDALGRGTAPAVSPGVWFQASFNLAVTTK